MSIEKILYDAITFIVNDKISKLEKDITIECIVIGKISDTQYEVQYQDAKFKAYSLYPFDGQVGHSVWVTIPNGDMSAPRKIIIYYE